MNENIKNARREIVEQVIEAMKDGTAPWVKPWTGSPKAPRNAITGRRYTGGNAMYLSMLMMVSGWGDGRFCTFNQAKKAGWSVRKGSRGMKVMFFSPFTTEKEDEDGKKETVSFPILKMFTVFHASQIEGIPELKVEKPNVAEKIGNAEAILKASGAVINHGKDAAFFRPSDDTVNLPDMDRFKSTEGYYATAMHELIHWTGGKGRLERSMKGRFGSSDYAYEELVAELGSMFLCVELGIEQTEEHFEHHASYIDNWIKGLRHDPDALFKAAADAAKAVDFLTSKVEGFGDTAEAA